MTDDAVALKRLLRRCIEERRQLEADNRALRIEVEGLRGENVLLKTDYTRLINAEAKKP